MKLKSVALETVTVSDAKPHYIWGLLCKVGCPHNRGLVSSGDVAHMFVLWDMHVHPTTHFVSIHSFSMCP